MITTLFSKLNAEATVLTPNQRLAANLLKKYNQYQQKQGLLCWPSSRLLPLKSFIDQLWRGFMAEEMTAPYLLLSSNQELILWEDIISATPESEQLLKLADLAKQAKSAWSTLLQWRIDFDHPSFSLTENCRFFQGWAEEFVDRCQKKNWLDHASLTKLLIEKIRQEELSLPPELILLNFTEISPQLKELLAACESRGVELSYLTLKKTEETENSVQLGVKDEDSEIQTMARWAKTILDREPGASIGCIASQLEEKRDAFLSVFTDIFGSSESFNISAGKTLASYPIIQQALQLLRLPTETLSAATISALLHSPFIGEAEKEMVERVQLDSFLRRRNMNSLGFQDFLKEKQTATCPLLLSRLGSYLAKRQSQRGTQKISQWILHFADLLESLGWPGEQSLNSSEYQVVNAWMNLLKETLSLDNILQPLSYHKALHYLTELVAKSFFQPQTPEAPIQVLGQLEGAGLPFDYLWVMGLDDTAWPPLPSPNPLLPQDLQKSLRMPNASAERQLEYSLRLTEQFKQAAGKLIFSYSQHSEKEELRPSPLIAKLPRITLDDLELAPYKSALKKVFLSQQLETFSDEQATAFNSPQKLAGGVSIFEQQAACPFKAFAKIRLNARALEETQAGLPAKNRGSVIHKALEVFWRQVKDQKTLLLLSEEKLQTTLGLALEKALQTLAPFIPKDSLYQSLVRQRLENLLNTWITLEKARPSFKVLATEQEKNIEFENYTFTLRIDRIDELAEGKKLIIDYKTKKACDLNAWFGERMDEPQLPLYCITSKEEVAGLAFAQLNTVKTEMKGLSQKLLQIAGIKTLQEKQKSEAADWELQLASWRENLQQVFQDFLAGKAEVNPKDPIETCRYCDLQTLCRIHEQRQMAYD